MKLESRSLTGTARSASSTEKFELSGVAAAYNKESRDLGGFVEVISPGAFKRSLANRDDVKALFNHNAEAVLGRVRNNTLVLNDSTEGLRFTVKLNPESQSHRD